MASGSAPVPGPEGEIIGGDYPIQRHAGKTGYGPNYNIGANVVEKVEGTLEEVVGKVVHNPRLVHEGHELRSGELKKRKILGDDDNDDLKSLPKTGKGAEKSHGRKGSVGAPSTSTPEPQSQTEHSPATMREEEFAPGTDPKIIASKGTKASEHIKIH